MAIILEAVPFYTSWRQGQYRIGTVPGLKGRLFIPREYRCMLRWLEIQAYDIGRLALKIGILRRPIPFGCDAVSGRPSARFGQSSCGEPLIVGPACGCISGWSHRGAVAESRTGYAPPGLASTVPGVQPGQAFCQKSFLPLGNKGWGTTQARSDVSVGPSFGQQEHQSSDPRLPRRPATGSEAPLKFCAFLNRQGECFASHDANHTTNSSVTVR